MQIVAAITDPSHVAPARKQGADLIELRLDLFGNDPVRKAEEALDRADLPVIATLRSGAEGGQFFGDAEQWMAIIAPLLPRVAYVDIEQRFAAHAPAVRAAGKKIIASCHEGRMLSLAELFQTERNLRAYGDIPKIIVTPEDEDDLVDLISFTRAAAKPICTGTMGPHLRFARAVLPLFGSAFAYCHTGNPTAPGQFSVAEFAQLRRLLGE